LAAIGGRLPAEPRFNQEELERFGIALDLLSERIGRHLWSYNAQERRWELPNKEADNRHASLANLSRSLITSTMLSHMAPDIKDPVALSNKGLSAIRLAQKLSETLLHEDCPPHLFRGALALGLVSKLREFHSLREHPDGRQSPTRACTPATRRGIIIVYILRLATGGQQLNPGDHFATGGRPLYDVACAFLSAAGIKGTSPKQLERNIEKAKKNPLNR
jgi:hypothetical protein